MCMNGNKPPGATLGTAARGYITTAYVRKTHTHTHPHTHTHSHTHTHTHTHTHIQGAIHTYYSLCWTDIHPYQNALSVHVEAHGDGKCSYVRGLAWGLVEWLAQKV